MTGGLFLCDISANALTKAPHVPTVAKLSATKPRPPSLQHLQDDHLLWIAYSYDGGQTWENATSTIGIGPASYPGVTSPRDVLVPYVVWQEGDSVLFSYDEFFPFMLFTPRLVDTGVGVPSIATTTGGDTVLISAGDINRPGATNNAYLYRSFNGGLTWQDRILMINTQGNPTFAYIECPRIQMGEGGYVFALFNWAPEGSNRFCPFYTESMDYGETWSEPQRVWPAWPPYPDATCCWYGYDVILDPADNYKPHCAIKLGSANYEFGDIWECHPVSGAPGNWTNWVSNLLIGDGLGGAYATHPSMGRDASGNLAVTFSATWIHGPGDTTPDIGICRSYDQGASWTGPEPLTHDPIYETAIELADKNPSYFPHLVYVKERDNPTSVWHLSWYVPDSVGPTASYCLLGTPGKNIYVDSSWDTVIVLYTRPCVGVGEIPEAGCSRQEARLCQNYPNPFSQMTEVRYQIPAFAPSSHRGDVRSPVHTTLKVYDLAGGIVRILVDERQKPGYYSVIWDGRDSNGRRAASGVYFYRLAAREYESTRKMILLR